MLLKALGVIRQDPETLVFTAAAVAVMAAPIALVVWLIAAPGSVVLTVPRGAILVLRALRPLGPLLMPAVAGLMVSACVILGGMLNCAVLGCALKRLHGGDPTVLDGLSAMVHAFGGLSVQAAGMFAQLAEGGRGRQLPKTHGLAMAVMVAEGLDAGAAQRRADKLAGEKPFVRQGLEDIDHGSGFALAAAMALAFAIGLKYSTATTVTTLLGPIFGLPVAVAIVMGSALSTLQAVAVAELYVKAAGAAVSVRGGGELV